jgi:hypothetical protein
MPSISSVPIIDNSASMTQNGFVQITKIDSKAFVRHFREGDRLAVVQYSDTASVAYPPNGRSLATVGPALSETADAADVIQALAFNGWATDIGAGILTARSLVDSAPEPRALVLLSDGQHNYGTDPLSVLPSYPIHTCAMGVGSDTALLSQIASRTGGTYHFTPRLVDMMQIYNQIRGDQQSVALVVNQLSDVDADDGMLIPATIAAGTPAAQFGVVWTNTTIQYTSGSPSLNRVAITLVDPSLNTLPLQPQVIGDGYVVFNVPNPAQGQWQVQVEYGGGVGMSMTAGGFEVGVNTVRDIRLEVSAAPVSRLGEPLRFTARVTDGGVPVEGLQVHAEVVQPTISVAGALKAYAGRLASVDPHPADISRGMPEPLARLMALRRSLLPEEDILAHRTSTHALTPAPGGTHTGEVSDTSHAGSYTLKLDVTGHSPVSGTPFQRSRRLSVHVG